MCRGCARVGTRMKYTPSPAAFCWRSLLWYVMSECHPPCWPKFCRMVLVKRDFFVFNPLVSGAFWSRAGLENMWWIWKCQVYAGASFNKFKENWPEKGWSSCFEDGASCFKLYRPSPGCAIRCEKTAVLLAWWRPSPCLSWPFHTKDKGGREEAPRVAERTLRAYGVVSYSTLE